MVFPESLDTIIHDNLMGILLTLFGHMSTGKTNVDWMVSVLVSFHHQLDTAQSPLGNIQGITQIMLVCVMSLRELS